MARKLLLADDSITIQKVVELILAEEGFEIKATNNGEEALAVIPSFKPDIILADIEMPKINGYQLSEKIKQDPLMRGIPVILLAGAFEPIDEELAKQVNADDFIIKPFESQELISKINAALTISSVAEGEEVEGIAEAEAVGLEEVPVEEDLWSMEEIPETAEVESWSMEEAVVAGTEELLEIAEEAGVEAAAVEEVTPPVVKEAAATEVKIGIPEVEFPSKDELKDIFEHTVNERISSLLSSLDLKEIILTSLMPSMKDSVEKILWEVVPDLAETMISKEIERIRSEF